MPVANETGIFAKAEADKVSVPVRKTTRIENMISTRTLLRLLAASTMVGIPFSVPSFSLRNRIMSGTTAAGETALRMIPSMSPSFHESPAVYTQTIAAAIVSNKGGNKANNITGWPTFLRVSLCSSKPALSKMTINAAVRNSPESAVNDGSSICRTYGPNRSPIRRNPIRSGMRMSRQSQEAIIPAIIISAIEFSILV
ncbi:hypothetical protein DSECCO2_516960 [anaerobic digester metagenome]